MDTLTDRSLTLIRNAVRLVGKKPLASKAGVSDALLRHCESPDFSPTARTMRKLELASISVLAERKPITNGADASREAAA